jgi:class 3 adenylate cyclase/predicted ATPase
MKFSEVVDQAREFLRRRERVSYRALKREFDLDDESLEDLKAELIDAQRIAVDEEGKVLVWAGKGETEVVSAQLSVVSPPLLTSTTKPPVTYTPSHLAERIRAEQEAMAARSGTDGERKMITALFADLKGSTALIEGLDPEEARAIIDPALQVMMDAVHRYEGYVAQALGDGIFALFGAPLAHEDHPQRALYAALRMQEEMRRYADQVRLRHGAPLAMRVGINTGEVVVRSIRKDDLHTDYVPVGHSTNLAARMEQMATPGSILVTDYTYKLTDGYFVFKALGAAAIKGVEEPLHVYEVLGAGLLRTRLQVTATRRGLTRFVGRQTEVEQLQRALNQAKAGHGQLIGVMGEPGLGKSRLFYEFKLLSQSGCLVLEAYSVSHGKASPYLPVIELLRSYFALTAEDDERTRREKITGKVLTLDRNLEDTLPYLFSLLGIEDPTASLQQMDPQIRRRRTFEALKRLFLRESLNQPLILIFEDLHWIDSETQGFLDVLSEGVASARILLLTNYRPEYRHEWGQKSYYTQLRLAPLGKEEAEELLTALLGATGETSHATSLRSFKQLILEKTQGTPFFMEEIVQELRERGVLPEVGATHTSPLPTDLHLPPTVQGILAARIDRLAPDEKALLQQLAVIGRQLPVSLIRHVVTQPEADLYRLLASLQHKEFLYEQPAFPESEYIFKHALTQEVAYNSVLQERRKAQHEKIARAVERLYPERLEEHYSELAHHYTRSGNTAKAVEYLHLAGQQAVQRSANQEAVEYLTKGLEFLKLLPDSLERAQQELALQVTLGYTLTAVKGFTAPEVEQTYARAYALCRRCESPDQLLEVLAGLRAFHLVRGELREAREVAEQRLQLAQYVGNSPALVFAHIGLGEPLIYQGDLNAAHEQLEQARMLYQPQEFGRNIKPDEEDPGMWLLSRIAVTLRLMGYPDQARQRFQECLALAERQARPFGLVFAWGTAGWFHADGWEWQRVRERAEEMIRLSTEQGFPYFLAYGTAMRGWALAEQGQVEEGIAQMQQGMASFLTTGAELGRLDHFSRLAAAYGKVGQIEEGLAVLAEALDVVAKTGARANEAEFYRLKGELTLQSKVQSLKSKVEEEAEGYFLKAIEIAQKQQAKSLELRAVMSLVRLRQLQSRQHEARAKLDEAHQMLSEVYNWFTEGFDTKDLQEAKVLLNELA